MPSFSSQKGGNSSAFPLRTSHARPSFWWGRCSVLMMLLGGSKISMARFLLARLLLTRSKMASTVMDFFCALVALTAADSERVKTASDSVMSLRGEREMASLTAAKSSRRAKTWIWRWWCRCRWEGRGRRRWRVQCSRWVGLGWRWRRGCCRAHGGGRRRSRRGRWRYGAARRRWWPPWNRAGICLKTNPWCWFLASWVLQSAVGFCSFNFELRRYLNANVSFFLFIYSIFF